jgi:tetratricopeptide (TPR) repeat protein
MSEVHEKIEISYDEIAELYDRYTEYNTIPAFRNIRQFVAADRRTARKHHRTIQRMLRRDQERDIALLTRQESLNNRSDGVILNIHHDGIIPGLGPDTNYNERVFSANIGVLSNIFKNIDNQYVFFYVIREEPEQPRSLRDIANVIMNRIRREKHTELFAQLKEELFTEYNVVLYLDRLICMASPEDLFLLADGALLRQNTVEAIEFLNEIITLFSNTEYEYNALFMKAFLTYDKLNDREKAITLYEEFLSKNTIKELTESAEIILNALKTNTPLELMMTDR